MADDNTSTEGAKRPEKLSTFQGYVQSAPQIKELSNGRKMAKLRLRVPNSQKDADGNYKNDVPSTFVDVVTFNAGQVSDMEKAIAAGTLKKDASFRAEGYLGQSTYEKDGVKRESWSVNLRGGKSAWSDEKPEAGKGLANDVNIRGVVGKIEVFSGVSEKTGKPYELVKMSVADKDDPDWRAKKAGTFTGEDRTKTTWHEITIATPKNVAAIKAQMDEGKMGVGAVVSVDASMVPDSWTDKDGNKREQMKFDAKPFADSITVIREPKGAKTTEKTAEASEPVAGETKGKGKGKGKGKAASKSSKYDDEIPF